MSKGKPKPMITVVTVVYNGAAHLEETIRSVTSLDYPSVQYIIIDGGSTDGTLDIIRRHEDKIAWWISEPDKGIYDAMNKGLNKADGEWINFMNCGDRFADKDVLKLFDNDIDADVICGNAIMEYQDFQTVHRRYPPEKMWKHSPFCHQATFIRASLMRALRYDTTYKIGADYDFFYRAYLEGKKFWYTDQVICRFDGRDGTTKKNIILSFHDMINSSLRHSYSVSKWLYFQGLLLYVHLLLFAKKVVGTRLTGALTRMAKETRQ